MATETTRLQGEVSENFETREIDVEFLLVGFLRALLKEQGPFVLGVSPRGPAPRETM